MKSFYAVYRKEMGHYFVSPVAYVIAGVFLILSGWFFNEFLVAFIREAVAAGIEGAGSGATFDVPSLVIRQFFGVISVVILFLTPMLTMSIYAEERRRGTMELLMTSPVTDTQIVLGKFLASLTLFGLMLLPTLGYFGYMLLHADPPGSGRILLSGYLGIVLLGGALLALGGFFSSLTESQLIASVLSFGAFLLLWVIDLGTQNGAGGTDSVLQYMSLFRPIDDDFARGIVDTSNVIFYLSFIVVGVFLTVRSVDAMRWRRA